MYTASVQITCSVSHNIGYRLKIGGWQLFLAGLVLNVMCFGLEKCVVTSEVQAVVMLHLPSQSRFFGNTCIIMESKSAYKNDPFRLYS